MNRPKILHIGGTLYWVLRTRNPDTQVLKDADSDPTVAIRKNGASTADSVTVTKRAATTGIYDCSYNPAGEVEGDEYTVEESATVTGTTTGSATYTASWEFTAVALERGTNGANTVAPATPTNVTDARDVITGRLPAALVGGRIDASVGAMAANVLTAAAIATNAIGADEISAAAANKLADHIRRRTQANVETSSDGDALDYGSLYGLIQQGQESNTVDSPGNLRVYRTNGSTILATRPITTDATADPVTGIS